MESLEATFSVPSMITIEHAIIHAGLPSPSVNHRIQPHSALVRLNPRGKTEASICHQPLIDLWSGNPETPSTLSNQSDFSGARQHLQNDDETYKRLVQLHNDSVQITRGGDTLFERHTFVPKFEPSYRHYFTSRKAEVKLKQGLNQLESAFTHIKRSFDAAERMSDDFACDADAFNQLPKESKKKKTLDIHFFDPSTTFIHFEIHTQIMKKKGEILVQLSLEVDNGSVHLSSGCMIDNPGVDCFDDSEKQTVIEDNDLLIESLRTYTCNTIFRGIANFNEAQDQSLVQSLNIGLTSIKDGLQCYGREICERADSLQLQVSQT